MPNKFEGVGNLADAPAIKNCRTRDGRSFKAAEMRVFFDEYSRDGAGEYTQSGGMWLAVTAYEHVAENCARLLQKGARVKVEGRLTQFNAHDDKGNEVAVCAVEASHIYLSLARIEEIEFSQSKGRPQPGNSSDDPRHPAFEPMDSASHYQ